MHASSGPVLRPWREVVVLSGCGAHGEPVSSRLIRMLELLIYRADSRPRNEACRKVSDMEGGRAARGSHILRDLAFSVSRYIGLQDRLHFTAPSSTATSQALEGE